MENKTFKELFYNTDLIIIIDTSGKVMYYEDYNDNTTMLKSENVIGRSIFEMYPYFKREDFTIFKAIDRKRAIINEYQTFIVDGQSRSTLNSAFPLINDSGVVGGMVISVELPRQSKKKKNKLLAKYNFKDVLTANPAFQRNLRMLEAVSKNDSNILIVGDTGTGKEMIAHSVHGASDRRNEPLFIQNCAAIPSTIMESILFGSAKGSFTGAIDKEGVFEAARGGTLFLDEINSMPLDLQSKVLRAIENKTIRRIGENIEREINVRIISATNEDLLQKVATGGFREDLYYRLNVVNFVIPPLRERKEDISLIAAYYIDLYNKRFRKTVKGFSPQAKAFLEAYPWKGNVRELKNVIEYVLNVKDNGFIEEKDLPTYMGEVALEKDGERFAEGREGREGLIGKGSLSVQVEGFEKEVIENALKQCRYNVTRAAEYLEIPKQTLYYKTKKYGLL